MVRSAASLPTRPAHSWNHEPAAQGCELNSCTPQVVVMEEALVGEALASPGPTVRAQPAAVRASATRSPASQGLAPTRWRPSSRRIELAVSHGESLRRA
jgi:hypothetical protein